MAADPVRDDANQRRMSWSFPRWRHQKSVMSRERKTIHGEAVRLKRTVEASAVGAPLTERFRQKTSGKSLHHFLIPPGGQDFR